MTTTTILSAGTTAATSSDVTIASGAIATIALFVTDGGLGDAVLTVLMDTPGEDLPVQKLDLSMPVASMSK